MDFENQYTQKLKGTGCKTQWICGFLNGGLAIGKPLVAQNDVDL